MPEFSQSRDEHARQKELFEESYSRKLFFNRKELQPVGLGVCHPKEINLYQKWQQHRESCSQAVHHTAGGTGGHSKRLKSESIQSVPFTLSTKKRQQEIIHEKSKNKVMTKWLQRAADMETLRQPFTPRLSKADTSNLLGIFTPIRSCESYSFNAFPMYSVTDSDNDKPYSISGARSLSFHDSYTIKTAQPNTTYKLVSQASIINYSFLDLHLDKNFHQDPISYMDNKRIYVFNQQRLQKKKLHRKPISISDFIIQRPYDKVRQSRTRHLLAPETNSTPYAKTVTVYTVFNQKPTKTQPRNTLGSNACFNIKFYRSMGDRPQMCGINAPRVPIPRNCSPTNMARMGRDEDGCICMYIPQQPNYERFRMGNGNACECDGFLKRYLRILLKEQKRCCKARSKPKPYSYASNSANYIPPTYMDYQHRYNNASNNFCGNNVSCQCNCKERREQRPDRDIFCKNRGTTCCVPKCPGVQNNPNPVCNTANYANGQTKGMPDKDAVNIGSNFSFQVGLYKRCLDNRPAPACYRNPNPPPPPPPRVQINPNPNNYNSFNNNSLAYEPYMQSVQPCIDACSFSCSDASSYCEPKSASVFSDLLRSREPKFEVKCCGTQRSSLGGGMQRPGLGGEIDCCSRSQSSSKPSFSQFIKSQLERNDLCCNNLPMSHCKPKKNKAVRCRCFKRPKLVGCTDQKSSVGIICSRRTSGQSASTGQKSNNIKHSGCNCVGTEGMQRPGLGGEIDCCSRSQSSSKPSFSQFIKSQLERNDLCCNNLPMSHCKPKKNKAVRCRCSKKPKLVGCTDQTSSVGIICSRRTSGQSASTGQKSNNIKHSGCNCVGTEGYLATCKKKIAKKSSKCCRKKSRKCGSKKSCECCCKNCSKCCVEKSSKCCVKNRSKCCGKRSSKCCVKIRSKCCGKRRSKCCCNSKIPKRKKCRCKKQPTIFKICRTLSTLLQEKSEGGCCRCKTSDAKNKYDTSCCCNNTSHTKFKSIVRPMSMLLQKIGNRCNLAKKSTCRCSNNSGEFDYKKVVDRIKMSEKASEKAKAKRCLCGDFTMKKILSSQLVVSKPPPNQLAKAQQCGCIEGSNKTRKMFGRLLLFNTVPPRPICCSRVTYDQNSRTIGTGEDDYRKVPPNRRAGVPDGSQGDGLYLKKLVSKLINPPKCCTRMHYTAFNPRNQCEAGVQHIGRVGPDERAGRETVCKNQGVVCPRSKPLTMKDCETACPASQKDSDRRAVRLGSSCSFCLEFYKGAPPPKNVPTCPATRSAPPAPPPRYVPCAEPATTSAIPEGGNICYPTKTPGPALKPIMEKALTYLILTQKKSRPKKRCQQCNRCVEAPLIKKGFANIILKNTNPVTKLNANTCQKTNTLQPNLRLKFLKGKGGPPRGKSSNCDPYVCLKRINQRQCCNAK